MNNTNNTINLRRRFNPEDFTIRGVASDILVGIGASVKNTAMLGVATVEIINAWIPIIKDLGYVTVEFGEVASVGIRQTVLELNIMLEEWRKDSCIPEEIRDFNVPMSELVEKTMKAREAKEKAKNVSSVTKEALIEKVKASSNTEEVKKALIEKIEDADQIDLAYEVTQALYKELVESSK